MHFIMQALPECNQSSQAKTETLIHAFIICRSDCCKALLCGPQKKKLSNLLQDSAACVVTKTEKEH